MRRMIAAGPPAKRPPHIELVGSARGSFVRGSFARGSFTGGSAWFGTALFVLLIGLPAAIATGDETIRPGEFIAATPPQPAPQAEFTDADGKPVTLAEFEGKP